MRRLLSLSLVALCACGGGGAGDATPDSPETGPSCTGDSECDDGVFCNGIETCTPGAGAGPDGCLAGADPCDGATCDEAADECASDCDVNPDADGDGSDTLACGGDDCDDADPNRFPGNPEVCDAANLDEDCDPTTFGTRDSDGDGHVDAACCNEDGVGTLLCGDDCNDGAPDVYAGLVEACDGVDNDCDVAIDEGVLTTFTRDADGDGFGETGGMTVTGCGEPPSGFSFFDTDCDDSSPLVGPAAPETCVMGDQDCDGEVDEGLGGCMCSTPGATRVCSSDVGECRSGSEMCTGDGLWTGCDGVLPAGRDFCNGLDEDCDSSVDEEGALGCAAAPPNADPACTAGACDFACHTNFDSCDMNDATGCERDVRVGIPNPAESGDVLHCGACGVECLQVLAPGRSSVPTGTRITCTGGTCGSECTGIRLDCDDVFGCDYDNVGELGCPDLSIPPRQLWPMAGMTIARARPFFYADMRGARANLEAEVCRDRACTSSLGVRGSASVGSGSVSYSTTLAPGAYWWRVRMELAGGSTAATPWGPTRFFRVYAGGSATGAVAYGAELSIRDSGLADVVIGRSSIPEFRTYRGVAGSGLPASGSTIAAPSGSDRFGISVAPAGDVNGDGFGDVIVGDCGPDGVDAEPVAATCADRAFIYHGSASGLARVTTLNVPSGTNTGFGYSVASAGDVNRDGYGDVVVGAYWLERAYVYLGSASGVSSTPHVTLSPRVGAPSGTLFGVSVSSTDFNADAHSDVIVGSPLGDERAYVFYGSATGVDAAPDLQLAAPASVPTPSNLGLSVYSAGDFNGDGFADIVAGGNASGGVACVFLGDRSADVDATADVCWRGTAVNPIGLSVAGGGDYNGDGFSDVLVGAPDAAMATVFVYHGGSTLPTTPSRTLTSGTANFGRFVADAGDTNGDDIGDFVVGACGPVTCENAVFGFEGRTDGVRTPASWAPSVGSGGFGLGANR